MPKLVMIKKAAGPMGSFHPGKAYTVSPELHKQFCEGEDPAALDFEEAAEIAVEERGEKRDREWKPAPQPEEIELPEPKSRGKKRANRRG